MSLTAFWSPFSKDLSHSWAELRLWTPDTGHRCVLRLPGDLVPCWLWRNSIQTLNQQLHEVCISPPARMDMQTSLFGGECLSTTETPFFLKQQMDSCLYYPWTHLKLTALRKHPRI